MCVYTYSTQPIASRIRVDASEILLGIDQQLPTFEFERALPDCRTPHVRYYPDYSASHDVRYLKPNMRYLIGRDGKIRTFKSFNTHGFGGRLARQCKHPYNLNGPQTQAYATYELINGTLTVGISTHLVQLLTMQAR